VLGHGRHPALHWVLVDVLAESFILQHIAHATVVKTVFPDVSAITEFFPGSVGESALDKLHRFFQSLVGSQEEMEMIRHEHKFMEQEFALISVVSQYFQKELRHAVGLKDADLLISG